MLIIVLKIILFYKKIYNIKILTQNIVFNDYKIFWLHSTCMANKLISERDNYHIVYRAAHETKFKYLCNEKSITYSFNQYFQFTTVIYLNISNNGNVQNDLG